MSALPLFPHIGFSQCHAKPGMALVYLAVWAKYLKEVESADVAEVEATRVAREDLTNAELTCAEYAQACAKACQQYLSDEQVATVEAKHGISFNFESSAAPFRASGEGRSMFSRPLAFANLFGLGRPGPRAEITEKARFSFKHVENPINGDHFEYYGPELRQEDLSLFLWLTKLNERKRPGVDIRFDARVAMADLGRAVHKNNMPWLVDSISALERAHIRLYRADTNRFQSFSLLDAASSLPGPDAKGNWSLSDCSCCVRVSQGWRDLLCNQEEIRQVFALDLNVRRELTGKPLSLWMHAYLSAHLANPAVGNARSLTRSLATLAQFAYAEGAAGNKYEFAKSVKRAIADLEGAGFLAKGASITGRGKTTFVFAV